MVPGLEVRTVQSSCCGMAGSFGYEAEHYEVSMRMGELSLLPEARKAGDALVVADGTSCRQQIAHGAGKDAWHVARVLESALSGAGAGSRS
jgi:Fe-S oxidoreductase